MLLKKYSTILTAVGSLNFSILIPFVLGAIAGLISFSRVLGYLLAHFYQRTLLVIKGILLASLWVLWPYQNRVYETVNGKQKLVSSTPYFTDIDHSTLVAVGSLMLAGFVLVVVIHRLSSKKA